MTLTRTAISLPCVLSIALLAMMGCSDASRPTPAASIPRVASPKAVNDFARQLLVDIREDLRQLQREFPMLEGVETANISPSDTVLAGESTGSVLQQNLLFMKNVEIIDLRSDPNNQRPIDEMRKVKADGLMLDVWVVDSPIKVRCDESWPLFKTGQDQDVELWLSIEENPVNQRLRTRITKVVNERVVKARASTASEKSPLKP